MRVNQGGGENRNHDAYTVPGLQRGLNVLEIMATARRPMGITDLANEMGLSRSSVFRLVYTLKHMGFLEEAETTKLLTLGARVLNMGFAFLSSKDIIELSRGELEHLRDVTEVTAHLAIRDRTDVLYLNCVQTRSGFLSNMNVGSRMPVYAAPLGWCLLSRLSELELTNVLEGTVYTPFTDVTPTGAAALETLRSTIVRDGFVVSRGAMEAGGSSIAAPVFDRSGTVVAAIDISGPDIAFKDLAKRERELASEVLSAATRISARLGHAGDHRSSG